jgi:hypothetical protein
VNRKRESVARRRHGGLRNRGALAEDNPKAIGDRDELRRFSPSAAQIRYKTRIVAALRSGQPVTDTAICRHLRMSRQTVWEWRQDGDFRRWLTVDLDQDQLMDLRFAIARHLRLAFEGSTRSLLVLARLKEQGVF